MMRDLTELERRIIDFERNIFPDTGSKESAVLAEFGWSGTQYFYRLNFLLDEPEAMYYAPQTIARLRRLRDLRRSRRIGRDAPSFAVPV